MSVDQETLEKWEQFDRDVEKHSYGKRVALILTQMINVVFLNGSQDQTTSGHIARMQYEGRSKWYHDMLCKGLKWLEADHCWLSRKE